MVYTGQQKECFNQEAGSSAAAVRHPQHMLLQTYTNCRYYTTVFTVDKTVSAHGAVSPVLISSHWQSELLTLGLELD